MKDVREKGQVQNKQCLQWNLLSLVAQSPAQILLGKPFRTSNPLGSQTK